MLYSSLLCIHSKCNSLHLPTPNSQPILFLPPPSWQPLVCSPCLYVCFCFTDNSFVPYFRFHVYHTVFIFLWLTPLRMIISSCITHIILLICSTLWSWPSHYRGANQDTVELLPQGDKISNGWRLSLKLGSSPWERLTESVSCTKRLLWFFLHEFSEIRALRVCFSFSGMESHFLISAGSMWRVSITAVNLKSRNHSSGQEEYISSLINSSRELSQWYVSPVNFVSMTWPS